MTVLIVLPGCGDFDEYYFIDGRVCPGISNLAKEDPDNDAFICHFFWRNESGSLHERRPMRNLSDLLCQPVVTNHNSFSVSFPGEVHQSRLTHGITAGPVSGDSVTPVASIHSVYFLYTVRDFAKDVLLSASLIIA